MKLTIGLGNPGKEYELTRHNCGFLAVRYFAEINRFPKFEFSQKFNSLISEKGDTILCLPQTFMNESGKAVKKIRDYYKIPLENIIVIHDDADLPLGALKISENRGSAGHKGVQSVINALKTKNFIRCRIGINSKKKRVKAEKIVLKKLSKKELQIINEAIKKCQVKKNILTLSIS